MHHYRRKEKDVLFSKKRRERKIPCEENCETTTVCDKIDNTISIIGSIQQLHVQNFALFDFAKWC